MHKMANPKSTNVKPLSGYHRLTLPEMLAVQLKAQRCTYSEISASLNASYGLKRSVEAIRDWYRPGGRLTVALDQYQQLMAAESLKETQLMLMRLTLPAIVTLARLLDHPNPRIQLKAATVILNLTIPNVGASTKKFKGGDLMDLPVELIRAAEPVMEPTPEEESDAAWDEMLTQIRIIKQRVALREMAKVEPVIDSVMAK